MYYWMIHTSEEKLIVKSRTRKEAQRIGRERYRRGNALCWQISEADAARHIANGVEVVEL